MKKIIFLTSLLIGCGPTPIETTANSSEADSTTSNNDEYNCFNYTLSKNLTSITIKTGVLTSNKVLEIYSNSYIDDTYEEYFFKIKYKEDLVNPKYACDLKVFSQKEFYEIIVYGDQKHDQYGEVCWKVVE